MPNFTLINFDLVRDVIASVHKAGCRDIKREERFGHTTTVEATNAKDVVAMWINEEMIEMGYSARDVKIHACCSA